MENHSVRNGRTEKALDSRPMYASAFSGILGEFRKSSKGVKTKFIFFRVLRPCSAVPWCLGKNSTFFLSNIDEIHNMCRRSPIFLGSGHVLYVGAEYFEVPLREANNRIERCF